MCVFVTLCTKWCCVIEINNKTDLMLCSEYVGQKADNDWIIRLILILCPNRVKRNKANDNLDHKNDDVIFFKNIDTK